MMQNNESNPSFTFNEVDQNPTYINTEFVNNDQPPTSLNNKPPKRQRKPSKTSAKKSDETFDPQQNSSCNNSSSYVNAESLAQNSSTPFIESKTMPEYKPFGQSQYQPFFNIPPMLPQIPFNPYNQILPLPFVTYPASSTTTSYPYNQFAQHREAPRPPTMQNMMQMASLRNQAMSLLQPAELYQQPPFGLTELQSQSNPDLSQMYSQTRAWMDSQAMKRRHYESGAMSAFETCKKPRPESTISNYTDSSSSNSPYSTQCNDIKEDTAVTSNQTEDKKTLDVIDEKFDFSCVICQENRKDTVLLPCRHLCVCEKCCANILICPLCRKVVVETLTVFT